MGWLHRGYSISYYLSPELDGLRIVSFIHVNDCVNYISGVSKTSAVLLRAHVVRGIKKHQGNNASTIY